MIPPPALKTSSATRISAQTLAHPLTAILSLSLTVFVISFASIKFTRETNSVATFWPVNAILLAAVLRGGGNLLSYIAIFSAGTIGLFASNVLAGNGLLLSTALTIANLAEVGAAFWLLRKFDLVPSEIAQPRTLAVLLVFACGVAPLAGATIGATAVAGAFAVPMAPIWSTWYAADALGMAIIAPFALLIGPEQWRKLRIEQRTIEVVGVVALIVLVSCVASYYRSFLFVVVPVILLATFRFGVIGAAAGTLIVALTSTVFIVMGIGPLLLSQSGLPERIFVLQIFLAATLLGSLPVAAALADRDRFADRLSRAKAEAEAIAEAKSQDVVRLWRQLWQSEEKERLRLAHELHDRTGQNLAATMLELRQVELLVADDARDRLQRLRVQLEEMGKTLHDIARELRPGSIDELGLERALADYVSAWGEKYGIDAELHCGDTDIDQRPEEVRTTIYRVTQEALTNVAKHASGATAVSVSINRTDALLRLTIEDNGRGFDIQSAAQRKGGGLGLAGMRERLSLIGGHLDIESARGSGTTLFARIPLGASS